MGSGAGQERGPRARGMCTRSEVGWGTRGGNGEAQPSSHWGHGLHMDGDAGCWGDHPHHVPGSPGGSGGWGHRLTAPHRAQHGWGARGGACRALHGAKGATGTRGDGVTAGEVLPGRMAEGHAVSPVGRAVALAWLMMGTKERWGAPWHQHGDVRDLWSQGSGHQAPVPSCWHPGRPGSIMARWGTSHLPKPRCPLLEHGGSVGRADRGPPAPRPPRATRASEAGQGLGHGH